MTQERECEQRDIKRKQEVREWKLGEKNEQQTFFVLCLFRPHRCALEAVQLAA